jgi:hypothetical protein
MTQIKKIIKFEFEPNNINMKVIIKGTVLLGVLFFMGCSEKPSKQTQAKTVDAKAVMVASMERFKNAWNRGDAPSVAAEFTNDAVRVIANPMSPVEGGEAILRAFEATYSEESELYNSRMEVEVVVNRFISEDIMIGAGMFRILDENNNILEQGKWGNVFRYEDGKIKFLLESAHRISNDSLTSGIVVELANSITSEEPHFEKIQASIDNYMSNYNSKNKEGLAMLFIENAVQNVNSKEGIIIGRKQIKATENFSDGGTLDANILGYRYLGKDLAIAYGNWTAMGEDDLTVNGQWGNLFKISGDDALLVMESAGIR